MNLERGRLGFGLIEMMVSVFVLAIVVAVAAVFFGYYVKNYNFSFEQGRAVADADYFLSRVNAEIREMRVSEDGGYPLIAANDYEIAFYSDTDNDGTAEKVRYFLDGTEVARGVIEPSQGVPTYNSADEIVTVVADNVRNTTPIFYYYNQDWPNDTTNNPVTQSNRLIDTRLVKVELLVNINPDENEDLIINTEISMRNLKSN